MGSYSDSTLNMENLRRFAARVAKETQKPPDKECVEVSIIEKGFRTEVRRHGFLGLQKKSVDVPVQSQRTERLLGPYWVLRSAYHNVDTKSSKDIFEEYHEDNIWALGKDGLLWKIGLWTSFHSMRKHDSGSTVSSMSEADILALDHRPKSYEHGFRTDCHYWGDSRYPGPIARHAKGVGLSVELKALNEWKP